jgi:hypothetical protein
MGSKSNWAVLIGALIVITIIGAALYSSMSAIAAEVLDLNLLTFLPIVYSQLEDPKIDSTEFTVFVPVWELGASSADPTVGANGEIAGWYTKNTYGYGTKINLELYIKVRGGFAGIGTGSYEIYLPDEIEPALDWYVGHANVWIGGGETSEFDGSMKWTMRNTLKGPKLIFTFDGGEWSPTHPKTFADLKLRANISYWLQSIEPPS